LNRKALKHAKTFTIVMLDSSLKTLKEDENSSLNAPLEIQD
jgi:hypothetical protein